MSLSLAHNASFSEWQLETNIRTVLLAESFGEIGGRNFNLMRPRLEEQRIHNTRHVACDALARFLVGECRLCSAMRSRYPEWHPRHISLGLL